MERQAQAEECAERAIAGFPMFTGFPGFNGQALRLVVWPMELWLQWQADMLKMAAPAATEWMTRRREGTASALQTLERLAGCDDVKDISRIQSEWIEDETRRLETDVRALSGLTLFWPRMGANLPMVREEQHAA